MILLLHEDPSEVHAHRGPFLIMIEAKIMVKTHMENIAMRRTPKMVAERKHFFHNLF
jgi:hypothetical protein